MCTKHQMCERVSWGRESTCVLAVYMFDRPEASPPGCSSHSLSQVGAKIWGRGSNDECLDMAALSLLEHLDCANKAFAA